MSTENNVSKSDFAENIIVLRSVYGKVGMKYYIQPCKDKYGNYPDCVKHVDVNGDMILSDSERNDPNRKFFLKENEPIVVEDGFTLNLDRVQDQYIWEAIKNCILIAPDRYAKDENGNNLIDGTMDWKSKRPRYGVAELYVDKPGVETANKISRKRKIHQASEYIFTDERGSEGRLLKARLLGKNMKNMPDADVEDYLLQVAEKNPDKIINLYTGTDMSLRILFMEARDKKVIMIKNKLYVYGDDVVLGATDDAVITWMKDPKHKKILELIRRDVFPEQYKVEDLDLDGEPEITTEKEVDPVVERAIKANKTKK